MSQLKKDLGKKLAELRAISGLTQFQLAEKAGIGNEYISKIEQGVGSPSLKTLEKLAGALGVEVKDLFDFSKGRPKARSLSKFEVLLRNASEKKTDLIFDVAKRIIKD